MRTLWSFSKHFFFFFFFLFCLHYTTCIVLQSFFVFFVRNQCFKFTKNLLFITDWRLEELFYQNVIFTLQTGSPVFLDDSDLFLTSTNPNAKKTSIRECSHVKIHPSKLASGNFHRETRPGMKSSLWNQLHVFAEINFITEFYHPCQKDRDKKR